VAAASRLTPSRVAAAGIGEFGLEVAERVAKSENGSLVTVDALENALVHGVMGIAAMWRPCPDLCERLDELAFQAGTPWLPIVMEHPRIRVGPWGAAPGGPCYRCYCWRRRQHDTQPQVTRALEAAYGASAAGGPTGYLPHHVTLAVGLARLSLREQATSGMEGAADRVLWVNVVTGRPAMHRVIPSHGCTRCRPDDRLGGRLSLSEVTALLAHRRPGGHGICGDDRSGEDRALGVGH
jgi:bacteriocin biosynthesis cyclodehydratase domain-containing protein